jgi:glycosyltransferase involved in cell wall biosynthesis
MLVVNDVRRLTTAVTSSALETVYYRALVPRAARHASTLVTISEFSRHEIRRVLGVDAVVVAHHPPPLATCPAPTPDGGPLVAVGALRTYKGAETLIDALTITPPSERTTVVFCGPDEGAGERIARRANEAGVGNWVELRGWLPEEDLERLLAGARATVNPSLYEGYGLTVAESLARGLPTIASAIPPHLEVGGDAILSFEPGNARALARVLGELGDREARLEHGRRALVRSRTLATFGPTWAQVIEGAAGLGSERSAPVHDRREGESEDTEVTAQ